MEGVAYRAIVQPGRGMPSIQKRMFDRYDRDRDGSISPDEFHGLLQSLGYYLSPEEMDWALKIIDKDGSGHIDFKEFDSFYKSEGRFEKLRLNSETIEKYTVYSSLFIYLFTHSFNYNYNYLFWVIYFILLYCDCSF